MFLNYRHRVYKTCLERTIDQRKSKRTMAVTVLKPITIVEDLSAWQCPSCKSRYSVNKGRGEQCPQCDSRQNYRPLLVVDLGEFFTGRQETEFQARIVWVCAECECEFEEPYDQCPQSDCDSMEPPIPKIVVINPDEVTYVPKPASNPVPAELPRSVPQKKSTNMFVAVLLLFVIILTTTFVMWLGLTEGWLPSINELRQMFWFLF